MVYSPEKFPPSTPEKFEAKEEKEIINLIGKDKTLRGQYFEIREKLEREEIPSEERKEVTKRAKEINKELEPVVKELDEKSRNLYSEIMDIPVKNKKEWIDEQWNKKVERNKKVLEETEKKLKETKDIDPLIRNYLKERIEQKRIELGVEVKPELEKKEIPKEKPEIKKE